MNKIAYMFPGQGAQYTGMGLSLWKESPTVRRVFEEAEDIFAVDLKKACFQQGNKKELDQVEMAQYSVFVVSVAAYLVLKELLNIHPDIAAGHSLGELSALTCSNAISYTDMLSILKERNLIIQKHIRHRQGTMMWVINLSVEQVQEFCEEWQEKGWGIYVSAVNSPVMAAVSGEITAITRAARKLEKMGAIVYPLNMPGPFHSIYMEDAFLEFRDYLNKMTFRPFEFPVLSVMTAEPYKGENDIAETLSGMLASPIQWRACIQYFLKTSVEAAVEIGPKNILSYLMKNNTNRIRTACFQDINDVDAVKKIVSIQS